MRGNDAARQIKAFGMTNQMLVEDLQRVESQFSIDLGHVPKVQAVEQTYYPQFDAVVRAEAAEMSQHYEAFYCLEKTIRSFVAATIEEAAKSPSWWQSARVPPAVQSEVKNRIQKELDSAMTPRSSIELDYTTFGELAVIITANWEIFGGLFSSRKAVERVLANLNSLRGPIAHCSPLAEDEVVRLRLTVRDWFRLME
jgi:hypothetical protein